MLGNEERHHFVQSVYYFKHLLDRVQERQVPEETVFDVLTFVRRNPLFDEGFPSSLDWPMTLCRYERVDVRMSASCITQLRLTSQESIT